jgi:hypothetical protein
MAETLVNRIAWRRRGRRRDYVGTLAAGESSIRLTGRDRAGGADVVLTIPLAEVEGAHVSRTQDEALEGERTVVLELAESDPILMRELGAGPLHVHALARRLAAMAMHS